MARHSTPTLTEAYAHLELHDTGATAAQLPLLIVAPAHLRRPAPDQPSTTHRDRGRPQRGENVAPSVARMGTKRGNWAQSGAADTSGLDDSREPAHPDKPGGNPAKKGGWGGIRTPGGLAPSAVFKTAALVHSATHPVEHLAMLRATVPAAGGGCQTQVGEVPV